MLDENDERLKSLLGKVGRKCVLGKMDIERMESLDEMDNDEVVADDNGEVGKME